METAAREPLPLETVLPVFFLAVLLYGIAEFLYVHFRKREANVGEYGMAVKGMGFMIVVSALVTVLYGPVTKILFSFGGAALSPFNAGMGPLGWLYGFVIYELAYWLQHWLAHKVRVLWCLHSPHHAPRAIHMFVGFNHSFLETLFYMPFMLGFVPALLGVDPAVIAVLTFIDVIWGNLSDLQDGGDVVDLTLSNEVACGVTFRQVLYDSLKPAPGEVDFILVRVSGEEFYGASSAGTPRSDQAATCR